MVFTWALYMETAACIGPLRVLGGGNKEGETGPNAGGRLWLYHRGEVMRMQGVSWPRLDMLSL